MLRISSRGLGLGAWLMLFVACAPLTIDDERELGERWEREVRSELTFVRDRIVRGYIETIGREILQASGPQPFDYEFFVIEDDSINAFAGPAGHIYMHTGVILKARNVSEVAGVMAHEVGHVVKRHIADNYERQRGASVGRQILVLGAGVAGGGSAAGAANVLTGLAGAAYLNTFTRDAEREADAFAIEVMGKAGYDPVGMVTFFQTMLYEGGPKPPQFLSSHPTTEERIAEARRMIAEQPRYPNLRVEDGGRLEIIQRRVQLLTGKAAP